MRAYTYGISTVGSVLDLCLVELHLLLREDGLHLVVFLLDDFEKIFCEGFCALDLAFVGASVNHHCNNSVSARWGRKEE